MKIDQPASSATPLIRPAKSGSASATTAGAVESSSRDAAQVSAQVHALPGTPGGEFNAARVAEIREDIRAGRYQVNPERIADGLMDSVRDLLESRKNS